MHDNKYQGRLAVAKLPLLQKIENGNCDAKRYLCCLIRKHCQFQLFEEIILKFTGYLVTIENINGFVDTIENLQ